MSNTKPRIEKQKPTIAQIRLEQHNVSKTIQKLTIVNVQYELKKCVAIDINKLTQSVTKAVFRRYEAEKTRGIKLGFKAGKPIVLSVKMNDKYVLQTDSISTTTGTAAKIKINTSLFARDAKAAKAQFQNNLIFVIEENEVLNKEFKGAFYNPDKVNKPDDETTEAGTNTETTEQKEK